MASKKQLAALKRAREAKQKREVKVEPIDMEVVEVKAEFDQPKTKYQCGCPIVKVNETRNKARCIKHNSL